MNYVFIILIATTFFYSCSNALNHEFEIVDCTDAEMPEYDGIVVSILDNESGEVLRDTLVEKIKKTRNVFKPCRQYIYKAIYKTREGEIISENDVWMMATGKRWEWQPEKQDEISIQYSFEEEEIPRIKQHYVNKKFAGEGPFTKKETTGIIENVREVWMHPFRSNQYNFTEVAAFPHIKFPLKEGKTWTSNLQIGEGWGDWENTVINSSYEIKGKEVFRTKFKTFENCWIVESKSSASFGDSTHNFWFDESYGFVKMEYVNYEGQTLTFELFEVLDT